MSTMVRRFLEMRFDLKLPRRLLMADGDIRYMQTFLFFLCVEPRAAHCHVVAQRVRTHSPGADR